MLRRARVSETPLGARKGTRKSRVRWRSRQASAESSPRPFSACLRERFTSSHPPSSPSRSLQPPNPRRHLPESLSSRHFKPDINQNVFLPRHALFPKTPSAPSSTLRRPPPAAGRSRGRFAPFLPALRRL